MNRGATFELTLLRTIRAPREKVFDAFVQPEMMKAWMAPRGMSNPEVHADARIGGRFSLTMRARDGDQHTAGGTYREINRPERLVYTWQWQGEGMPTMETLITVLFTTRDGATEVRMTHSGFPDAALRDSHESGWSGSLNRLMDAHDERGTAASLTLIGDARSTFTRTARMGFSEKGIVYTMQTAGPHTPELLAVNPFGRIPALRDGDLQLFETSAILRYLDEAFEGARLLPGNPRERARCEQWVSAINSYVYDAMVRRYVLKVLFAKDGKPERAIIDPALKDIAAHLAIFDAAYGTRDFLVGSALCLADLFLAPILAYVEQMPEGGALMAAAPNVARAQGVMRARASFRDTDPHAGAQ